jgi:hypothetical protein
VGPHFCAHPPIPPADCRLHAAFLVGFPPFGDTGEGRRMRGTTTTRWKQRQRWGGAHNNQLRLRRRCNTGYMHNYFFVMPCLLQKFLAKTFLSHPTWLHFFVLPCLLQTFLPMNFCRILRGCTSGHDHSRLLYYGDFCRIPHGCTSGHALCRLH